MNNFNKTIIGSVAGLETGFIVGFIVGVLIIQLPNEKILVLSCGLLGALFGALLAKIGSADDSIERPKSLWVAALLNVAPCPLGFGYIYLGYQRRATVAFYIGLFTPGVAFIGYVLTILSALGGGDPEMWILYTASSPIIALASITAWDGWRLANKHRRPANQQSEFSDG